MTIRQPRFREDLPRDEGYLAEYRALVAQLSDETAAEFGGQPMPPEKLSMIAVALASLPLVALLLPTVPLEPQVWQVAAAEIAVWLVAFRIQSLRYHRFDARLRCKIALHRMLQPVPVARPLLRRR